ncbi:tRNA (guanine-N(1)-)-methyltransferase [Stappia sp. 22II-S9-Z10]|nr:tRNA (guanine-N(1)-)-methyltransferase [Stappia sp. 22II-S9-Z10]
MSFAATILTLYPEMFPGPLGHALAGRALGDKWTLTARNIRDAATDRHRTVDDTPAGGGPGMVMRADILARAIDESGGTGPLLLMSPRGTPFSQAMARDIAAGDGVTIVCGRFEGVDERVIERRGLTEVSIGDYILSGGEIGALAVLDAVVRLLPGVMGNSASADEESFADGLLEHPQYTRPAEWEGAAIPPVLTSGDHAKVAAWRRDARRRLTARRRPDLFAKYLSDA